jgi:hypothetical protein
MSRRRAAAFVPVVLLALGICFADETPVGDVVEGSSAPVEAAPPESFWRWTGDALLRYEAVRGAPNPLTSDFERLRLRLRPGVEARIPSGRFAAGAGLLVSSASDSNDWNMIRNDNFRSDEVAVDRAWVRWSAAQAAFSATFGVFEVPLRGTEVLWDRDLRFQGAAAGLELPAAGALVAQRITGGLSVGSQDDEDGSRVAAVRWEGEMARGVSLGGGFWQFGSTEDLVAAGYARTNRLAPGGEDYLSDYRVANATIGWEWIGATRPVRMRLDLLHNFGADDRREGVEARVDWGELQGIGSWRLRLVVQRIEQDATPAAFGGDEWWFRTAQRGARLGWGLGLGRHASVEFSVLRQRRDDLDDWTDRGWIDLGIAF